MSKFDFMIFTDGWNPTHFVIHAGKYTKQAALSLITREIGCYGEIKISDLTKDFAAYRFGISIEWPDGCYTFVKEGSPFSFPVWIVDIDKIKERSGWNERYK